MKLNAEIIFERLKKKYPVKLYGDNSSEMLFSSPEFYEDNTHRLHSNHLYLATVEHLPHRPVIERNVLLVCIGESPRLSYYKENAIVILLNKKVDFFEVYKSLQDIFELFHNWESRLLELFMKSPSIQDILNCTYPVFERSLFVLDASFQYVASSYSADNCTGKSWSQSHGRLDPEMFLSFLKEKEPNMDRRGAFLLDFESASVLCVNLFNSSDDYIGCLAIDQTLHPFIDGENQLAEYLAAIIEKISMINPVLLNSEKSSLKQILQILMNEMPLAKNQKILLKSVNLKRDYLCISAHYQKRFSSFPAGYICSVFETLFQDSVFFMQNNTVLGLVPASFLAKDPADPNEEVKKMHSFAKEMQLCIGISNEFCDLYMLRTFYRQAEAAIENGHLYRPNENIYYFHDFALLEMVANSLDGLPVEAYFPKGFRELLEHDQNSSISYLETLSVFLEENMSYAKAARRLFIHRSTLIERINRIESELSEDLSNPDQRLFLQLLLKALQIGN